MGSVVTLFLAHKLVPTFQGIRDKLCLVGFQFPFIHQMSLGFFLVAIRETGGNCVWLGAAPRTLNTRQTHTRQEVMPLVCIGVKPLIAFRVAKTTREDFSPMPGPEFFSKLHLTVLEIEGLLFNVLLFCRFCRDEIKSLWRSFRR